MRGRNLDRVPQPGSNDVRRERFDQFRLPGTSQVVEQSSPGFQTGSTYDPQELRAQGFGVQGLVENSRFATVPTKNSEIIEMVEVENPSQVGCPDHVHPPALHHIRHSA